MQKFSIKNRKGLEIVGDIMIPEKSIGLSFVLHGLGGFRAQNHIQTMVQTLFENNYTVVNFDATNSIGESGGKYEDATMQNHYEDLVDVITWSKTQNWYKEPFILIGHSMGGFAVAKYAEEYSNEIKGVFPHAAAFIGHDLFDSYTKFDSEKTKAWKENGWDIRISNSKPGIEMKLPWSFMEDILKYDLTPKVRNLTMPILFVVGENDIRCIPDQQKKFYDLLPINTQKEFHIIKGAPHTFKEEGHLKELKDIFDNWIKKL